MIKFGNIITQATSGEDDGEVDTFVYHASPIPCEKLRKEVK